MKSQKKILADWLKERGRVAVALSGGLDSSTLLAVCADVLGAENCLAITAMAPYMMKRETDDAIELTSSLGVNLIKIKCGIPDAIIDNPPERCYLCKCEVFSKIKDAVRNAGFEHLADGTNADDTSDYRPGMRALKEMNVLSPLLECGLGKTEIRAIARSYGLKVAEKPAYACLLTRLEHGRKIELPVLSKIDRAEAFINDMGFKQVRVRVNGDCARIEVPNADQEKIFNERKNIADFLKDIGFKYVSLDMCGYARGNMNRRAQ